MAFIELSNSDKRVLVDDGIYEELNKYNWQLQNTRNYAMRSESFNGASKTFLMHRYILGLSLKDGKHTDHINGNGLDNRRENLRICNPQQNSCNRSANKRNKSGYKGVHWKKRQSKWYVEICKDKKTYHLGVFDCPIEAAKAYNNAAIKYHGEFARLNEV